MLSPKAEHLASRDFFYVFVDLKRGSEKPDFYVVPSRVVAKFARTAHRAWMRAPGRNGRRHKDGGIRSFWIDDDAKAKRYLNNWSTLPL